MAHQLKTGWPSTAYEWWNNGKKRLDRALGGELVYARGQGPGMTLESASRSMRRFLFSRQIRPETCFVTCVCSS